MRDRALACAAVALALVAACTPVRRESSEFGRRARPAEVDAAAVAARAIQARDLRGDIAFLASDAMAGRANGSAELERAAAWLAGRFHELGVRPAGDAGGYAQFWPREPAPGGPPPDTVARVPNVVGMLPGSDAARAGAYVIVVAHLDHRGVGEPDEDGDSIYNGANDNASGVAALLAVARAFAELPARPPRPVLFLATTGHEAGLAGAEWFVANSPVFLDRAVAALNLDAVAGGPADTVFVAGETGAGLARLIQAVSGRVPGGALRAVGAGSADRGLAREHAPFARRGLPAFTLTGAREPGPAVVGDEAGGVYADRAARVARLAFLVAHVLATAPAPLETPPDPAR